MSILVNFSTHFCSYFLSFLAFLPSACSAGYHSPDCYSISFIACLCCMVVACIHESLPPTNTHIHSETLLSLALIRLTNVAAQLPFGSGETKGVLVLRTHLNARKYKLIYHFTMPI
jgi:hypothetical protein